MSGFKSISETGSESCCETPTEELQAAHVPRWSIAIAHVVRWVHHSIVLWVLFGWSLPWKNALIAHLIFLPLMVLHWQFNRNTCILSNLELWLRGQRMPREKQPGFVKTMIEKIVKRPVDSDVVNQAAYVIVAFSWAISLAELM